MKKLRILLADDHAVMREGLKLLVNAQPDMEVIDEAGDGKEVWQKAKELRPDVVVMDISMPEMSGMQATELLKRACPEVKVLALTAYDDQDYLRQMLKVGAAGYVLKFAAAEGLIHAIRTAAAGGTYLDPAMAAEVVHSYIRKPSSRAGHHATGTSGVLSDREREVLRLIAWGYNNKEIAAQLHIGVRTVETYKTRLMEKLQLRNRADIVRYASRQGWLQEAYPSPTPSGP